MIKSKPTIEALNNVFNIPPSAKLCAAATEYLEKWVKINSSELKTLRKRRKIYSKILPQIFVDVAIFAVFHSDLAISDLENLYKNGRIF
jgi:hypothetical protein